MPSPILHRSAEYHLSVRICRVYPLALTQAIWRLRVTYFFCPNGPKSVCRQTQIMENSPAIDGIEGLWVHTMRKRTAYRSAIDTPTGWAVRCAPEDDLPCSRRRRRQRQTRQDGGRARPSREKVCESRRQIVPMRDGSRSSEAVRARARPQRPRTGAPAAGRMA